MPSLAEKKSRSLWWPEELEAWRPPEDLTVSEHADKYRVLKGGIRWETDRLPFMRDVQDSFAIDCIEEIWLKKPTQTGGTEALLNMILYAVRQDPGDSMLVEPSEDMANEISQERIDKMIEFCDGLQEVKHPDDDETTKKKKTFTTMTLFLAWAGSPKSLASRPCRNVFFDEVNKYSPFSSEEASPIALGKERTTSILYKYIRKLVFVSTPTTDKGNISTGEAACNARFRFQVPCPHCGHRQELVFIRVIFDSKKDPEEIEKQGAWYECEKCQGKIHEDMKNTVVSKGKWIDLISGLEFHDCIAKHRPQRVGFSINRLYSPVYTFGEVAAEFLRSKDEAEKLMNWKNSWMAEEWIETAEAKSVEEIYNNRTPLPPLVCPKGTLALTAWVDPGQGGFWFTVLAWRREERSITPHLVQYGFLVEWESVRKLFWENVYQVDGEEGNFLGIWRGGVDTGGSKYDSEDITMTEAAYNFIRQYGRGKVLGGKGMSIPRGKKLNITVVDRMPGKAGKPGLPIPGGLTVLMIDTGAFKDAIHYRLGLPEKAPGRFTLHNETNIDFVSHITAEVKERNAKKGTMEWVKKGKHNHYLDCLVGCFALADPERQGGVLVLAPRAPKKPDGNQPPRRHTGWVNGWK